MAESDCAHVTRELEGSATPPRSSIPLAEPRSDECMDTKPTPPAVLLPEPRGSEFAVSATPRPSRSGFSSPIRRPSRTPSRSRTSSRALPPPPLIFGLSPIRRTLTTPDRAPSPSSLPSPVTSLPAHQAVEDEMPVLLEQSDPEAHPSLLAQHQIFHQDVNIPSGLRIKQLHRLSDTEQERYLRLFGQDKSCSICTCPLAEPTTLFDEVSNSVENVREGGRDSIPAEPLPKVVDASAFVRAFPCRARHIYHSVCIAPWLDSNTTCPMCREDGRAPAAQYPMLPSIEPPSLTVDLEGEILTPVVLYSPLLDVVSVIGEMEPVDLAADLLTLDEPENMLEVEVARPSGVLSDLDLTPRFQTQIYPEFSVPRSFVRLVLGSDDERSGSDMPTIAPVTLPTDAHPLAQRSQTNHPSWLTDSSSTTVSTEGAVATRNELPVQGISYSWLDSYLEHLAPQIVDASFPPPTPPSYPLHHDVSTSGELQGDLSQADDIYDLDDENTRSLFGDNLDDDVRAVLLDVKQPELSFSEWLTEQESSGRYH